MQGEGSNIVVTPRSRANLAAANEIDVGISNCIKRHFEFNRAFAAAFICTLSQLAFAPAMTKI